MPLLLPNLAPPCSKGTAVFSSKSPIQQVDDRGHSTCLMWRCMWQTPDGLQTQGHLHKGLHQPVELPAGSCTVLTLTRPQTKGKKGKKLLFPMQRTGPCFWGHWDVHGDTFANSNSQLYSQCPCFPRATSPFSLISCYKGKFRNQVPACPRLLQGSRAGAECRHAKAQCLKDAQGRGHRSFPGQV